MSKKVKKLEKRVAEARKELERYEAKLAKARLKAQHKEIDHLEDFIEEGDHKWEDLRQLGRQAWRELKDIVSR